MATPLVEEYPFIENTDKDFILFIGTSHTAGCCERENSQYLKRQDVWCHHLADMLGYRYVKLGFSGCENWQLTQLLIECINVIPNFKNRCKMVIAEVRLGSFQLPVPYDELDENFYDYGLEQDQSMLLLNASDDLLFEQNILRKINHTVNRQRQVYAVNKAINGDVVEQKILQSIYELNTVYHGSKIAYTRSSYEINTMYNLCKAYGIDFFWLTISESRSNIEIPVYQQYKNMIQEYFNELFDRRIPPVPIVEYRKRLNWNNSTCKCGHFDETLQIEIAAVLHKYIQQHKE